jgi:hypothetical protein
MGWFHWFFFSMFDQPWACPKSSGMLKKGGWSLFRPPNRMHLHNPL